MPPTNTDVIADVVNGGAYVQRADPVFHVAPATPSDFNAQYPVLLDPTEILAMCSETGAWRAIPEERTMLKQHLWREMTSLQFASGSMTSYVGFADGDCPNPIQHGGTNKTVDIKNFGAMVSLTLRDIMHSSAVAGLSMGGINRLLMPPQAFEGLPGTLPASNGLAEAVANVREKELTLAQILVMNALDQMLVQGNKDTNALHFDGIETLVTAANGAHVNTNTASGTLSATTFNQFIAEGCAPPTHLFGHPATLQELASSYFQLGFQGSQVIEFRDGNRVVPGFNFASVINTAVGQLTLVGDTNFTRTNIGGGNFQSNIYGLRMRHQGESLVHRITQVPLAFRELAPGCTAVQFEVWTATALVIKHMCAHHKFTTQAAGNIVTTCPYIG